MLSPSKGFVPSAPKFLIAHDGHVTMSQPMRLKQEVIRKVAGKAFVSLIKAD